MKTITWNIRGIITQTKEVSRLINEEEPNILCL